MKIVYFFHRFDYFGGIQKILSEKINHLCKDPDNEIFLIDYKSEQDFTTFFTLHENLNKIFIGLTGKEKDFTSLYKKKITKILNEIKADVVITMAYSPEFKFLCSINDGSKKIVEFHSCYEYSKGFSNIKIAPRETIKERFSFLFFLLYAKKYNNFVTLTESDAEKWRKHLKNVIVIPNYIENHSDIKKTHTDESVIAVGRFEGPKNFPFLIKTWALVAEKKPNIKLKIYGSGILQNDMKTLINNLNLNNNIELIPAVSNIQDEYLKHKFLVSSSSFEGLPMVVLEAMSLGIPTVTLPMKGGMPDLVIDKQTGLVAKSRNAKDFADTIVFALNNNSLLEELGKNSLVASKNFDKEKVMQKWINLFKL